MKKMVFLMMLFVSIGSLSACTTGPEEHDVYVTVYPLQYVVEEIFEGTEYTVGIVPGVTSHESSVDWSPREIIAMTEAKYLFYVGANYDQYIDLQINSIFSNKDVELVKIEDETDYIQFIPGIVHDHDHDEQTTTETDHDKDLLGVDPHFWISPLKIQQAAVLIYDHLILKFDDSENVMENNYIHLIQELQTLSDAFAETIGNATKLMLTSTNIYGYLRHDYGLEYLPISPGYHEETEQFTSQQKEEIISHVLEDDIHYILYEKYTSSPLSNAVYDEMVALDLNPQKLEFHILQALSNDEIAQGNNYVTVMYDNLELLRMALECQSVE